jgi:predicted metal-dependent HD superfamily phosphohydrolase
MGDRFGRRRPRELGAQLMLARGKPPPSILAWGLGQPAQIGHNNGPPIEDEQPGYLWRRYRWAKVHAAAWKTPSMGVLKFRVARAEAAGLSYRDYMLTLLDTGRHAQAKDRDVARAAALISIRAAWATAMPKVAPNMQKMQSAIILSSLTAAYDDDRRGYHDLVHIAAVLGEVERHATVQTDRDAVVVAALFHDVIYDATRRDNEVASAALARTHLADLGADPRQSEKIAAMIEATRHREVDVASADADTALLLDCDLAIIASDPTRYRDYVAGVRHEYAHVPEDAWRTGRIQVLKAFLARPRIYATTALAAVWDAKARSNLADEIAALDD